ncbi:MAG: elongation factor P maturation arginine rhamnosyltransferase EarP [Burkholderiales bacterium]|jgi:uncharacterized repeat protein (TIGR03837 family)|nr:elongation factor P maturation arginine rhamnosyltransferase EarP [Burkholderiales bacterium]
MAAAPMPASWFILCRVVDHYGDAGVCWRLARQLANEYDLDITLFIDDLNTLQRLIPTLDTTQNEQRINNVTVRRLTDTLLPPVSCASSWETLIKPASEMKREAPEAQQPRPIKTIGEVANTAQQSDSFAQPFNQCFSWPAVIVDTFGGGLPASWLAALKRDFPPLATEKEKEEKASPKLPEAPRWIVLEYLSAEPWVETMHGLASPPPSINLPRHFFFPGFTEATGGLLYEKTLLDERDAFCSPEHFQTARRAFLERLGINTLPPNALLVSLFCYDTPALPALLDAWAASPTPVVCLIPETVAPETVQRWQRLHNAEALATRNIATRGALTLHTIPFLPQADFDRLLWCCDLNFVRGEDSFVRAQWAARPFVWQAYQQNEQTHLIKVDAFLKRYLAAAPDNLKTALSDFTRAWNDEQQTNRIVDTWRLLTGQLPSLKKLALDWAQQQSTQDDLARRLIAFAHQSRERFFVRES